MLRILHTADLHLDTPFTGSGLDRDQVLQRRSDLLSVFRRITDIARERDVHALLIAGDLFEEDYVSTTTLNLVFGLIAGLAPMPVFVSPGNHDPCHDGSPWTLAKLPANLHVFRQQSPATIQLPDLGLAVHGLGFRADHVTGQLWKGFSIPPSCKGVVNIILTHGAVREAEDGRAAKYLPIDPADLRASGADYVALGHYHSGFTVIDDRFTNSIRAAYPGSPEPLRAGREADHGVLLLAIDPAARTCTAERIVTYQRIYRRFELDLSGHDALAIDRAITGILCDPALAGALVELRLRGRIPRDQHIRAQDYHDAAQALFYFVLVDETAPDFDLDAIAAEETARGAFCRMIRDQQAVAADDLEREVLEEALWLGLEAFDGQNLEEVLP